MHGSLALHRGALFVGRSEKTARVEIYDLDGGLFSAGFSFRDERTGCSAVAGLAVDEDRRVFAADTPASRVRIFTVFGQEIGGLGRSSDSPLDRSAWIDVPGVIDSPVDVAVEGSVDGGKLAVASAGERRHAVQLFDGALGFVRSLRPFGLSGGSFRGVRGVAFRGRFLYVAETLGGSIQVFRDGEFHFAFAIPCSGGRFEPYAVAPLPDGRMVIACGGQASALLLVDPAGRMLRVLAHEGEGLGSVNHPSDVVVDAGEDDSSARIIVLDEDGERVQAFTLSGRCHGKFAERA